MSSPNTTSFIQKRSTLNTRDIFGTSYDSTVEIFKALNAFASAGADGEGIVKLPSGREINIKTLSGMTTYTVYLQLLEAQKEIIDNIFVFVKNLENKLDNLLST